MARKKVKDELLNHNYDGIQELDNDLPPWWLYLFYFTIIFGVLYMIYYHVLGTGSSQYEEYEQEMKTAAMRYSQGGVSTAEKASGSEAQELQPFTDADNLAAGKTVFMTHCQVCHGQNGEGLVGPNLTDEYWLHGGKYSDILRTIRVGVPEKGMIPWQPVLKDTEIQQVGSYILSLAGTTPPNAKAPEGQKMESTGN